ncbi:cytochrome c biogenesis protein CcsA [Blastopirellula sp. JC732]|uniref:Cytochrome c biogenesis protein CcsA n=1 Tax=Blastopirellula sediminis TaxID=2894196 RepID=A0A9X1MSH9_9BACT|nr:cytochrome c biogenesis protein CcsA [Blastopirellula sediminis]MCC9604951.1 cytochrome c biogenesis protein CcsA [Blastopirellula sediminis]MCC9631749.1 cytochrome c biogenesis protein CcsA [Blastopirellula sediminis]
MKSIRPLLSAVSLALVALWFAPVVAAEKFDATIWKELPVYHNGRVKPLDTLANLVVEEITSHDKTSVKLNLNDYYVMDELIKSDYSGAMSILPEGKERKFQPSELLLSWLAEPQKWERVPFIIAEHEDVRKALGLQVNGPSGKRLRFVSPYEITHSVALRKFLLEIDTRRKAEGKDFAMTPAEEKVWDVLMKYALYRDVTFDPRLSITLNEAMPMPGGRDRLFYSVMAAAKVMSQEPNVKNQTLEDQFQMLMQLGGESPMALSANRLLTSYRALFSMLVNAQIDAHEFLENTNEDPLQPEDPPTLAEVEPLVADFRASAHELAELLRTERDRADTQQTLSRSQYETIKPMFQEMLVKTSELDRLGLEMQLGLYEGSDLVKKFNRNLTGTLYVAPALNAAALKKDRDTENMAQPWLGLTTILYGSGEVLKGYPQDKINQVKAAWKNLASEYVAGEPTEEAQVQLAAALRSIGEQTDVARRKLVAEDQQDEHILAYTAYPPADSPRIAAEVRYNALDPFMIAWIICLGATLCYSLSFGVMRKVMFWSGTALLVTAIVWSTYAFYLRITISGWAPVTNMYETVVFVPWVVAVLGAAFLLLPLIDRGRLEAWRATACPGTPEATPLTASQLETQGASAWNVMGIVASVTRIPLMVLTVWMLAFALYSDGNRPIISDLNPLTAFTLSSNVGKDAAIWLVKMLTLLITVYFVPRLLASSLYAVYFIPRDWLVNRSISTSLPAVLERSYFGLAASGAATFFFCVASFAPVLDENFSPLQPVLRSNMWLTVHVLTIVASYGAGMLSWALGVIALFFYMFGKYRPPVDPVNTPDGFRPAHQAQAELGYRPPEQCAILAGYCYRAIQVSVLLLATGTILGGLWADVSWGRFWGWDPKEVWALISLLVYLAILHGRFAGWFNNFGLVVGTILGFTMIVFSWYGVNFLLPMFSGGQAVGLHSYGFGEGGQGYVLGFVALNLVYLGLAAVRFQVTNVVKPATHQTDNVSRLVEDDEEMVIAESSDSKSEEETEEVSK